MKTSAIVFSAPNNVQIREIEIPELLPDEILVRSEVSGVSVGTDGWILRNQFSWAGQIAYPIVPGYQRSGWVEAIGSEVHGIVVGDRVAATISRLEGTTRSHWGGHLHVGVTKKDEVYLLDAEVDFMDAAQMIVCQVGLNAVNRSGLRPDQAVLVIGDGCIGQMAAQVARSIGAHVVLLGHRPGRIELASKYSADEVFITSGKEWYKRLQSSACPISVVIDTVQNVKFFNEYLLYLAPETTIVLSGFSPCGFEVDLGELQKSGLSLMTVCGWSRKRNEAVLSLMAEGKISFKNLITHRLPVERAPEAWAMMEKKCEHFLGVNFFW